MHCSLCLSNFVKALKMTEHSESTLPWNENDMGRIFYTCYWGSLVSEFLVPGTRSYDPIIASTGSCPAPLRAGREAFHPNISPYTIPFLFPPFGTKICLEVHFSQSLHQESQEKESRDKGRAVVLYICHGYFRTSRNIVWGEFSTI